MSDQIKRLSIVTLVAVPCSAARADIITYNLTEVTAQTLKGLGTSFVVGCTVLAVAIVIASIISRRR